MQSVFDRFKAIEECINRSTFGRVFRLDGSGHPKQIRGASFFRELRAGLTTFATMAYIIAVNSQVLAETGGTCECDVNLFDDCRNAPGWLECQIVLKQDLVTATAAIAGLSSILFGFLTNLPVALGPGMGLNAYFTYQVVGAQGRGMVSYRIALTAVFVEGLIFMFLALAGLRQWLVKMIPSTIKTASGVGIGLFLTMVGLSYSAGIGAITAGNSTPVALGGCPVKDLNAKGECVGNLMTNAALWIGVTLGGILVAFLMAFRVKSAIIIGIALVSVLSWPRDTSYTYFPYTIEGNARYDFFKQVVSFHPIQSTLFVQDWGLSGATGSEFALALITFLYVDLIDCTATLYAMANMSGVVDEEGNFPRSTLAYCTDAACISIGSLFGCSPVTTFIESGAGIAEGGRTGLTAITTGLCFLLSLFLAPIFASIPPWATGSTLILVGCMMIRQVCNINWKYIGDSVPSFVTLVYMPMSYSVAYGMIAGMFIYVTLNTMIWTVVHFSNGKITPTNYEDKIVYSWAMGKRDMPQWMRRIVDKISGSDKSGFIRDELPETVDSGSTIRNSSHNGTEADKDGIMLEPYPYPQQQREEHDSMYQQPKETCRLPKGFPG
ncbi:xanthine/uracil permease family protein-like protein [Truncatella angustata]|uniref:Xanthine/uracil permease family protein-like protein n=1 Tax=Truncatella angustata TaxID=152316 RepID=A0A9P8UN35_9PEZI|nr:xanthine/uracil permease family protein-like protein [Truncatella angustata]KAH6655001.1 xanthine/uracil permease family protein-like protein [Truncatella angustata]